ncbi:glycosyltransferase family 2 protein [Flavobacterium adhaerens]|uniref:glycosyltransferase family 2 protein n=1 Tax=Flavobacterium adhaerens TaxID=3149043 RepID=UPI0032B52B25
MDISIIIVNYKSWNPLRKCLESILSANNSNIKFEVIIVDNFSDDNQLETFKKEFDTFIFIKSASNLGFAYGCNLGVKQAKGKYLLFLNPDTTIASNTLEVLYSTYNTQPEIGILSCLQRNKNNHFYNQKNIFPSLFHLFGISRHIYRKTSTHFDTKETVFYPDWVSGAVIYMSQDLLKQVNGWNEDYWLYYEDVEICKKISLKNMKIAVTRNTTIHHEHGGSTRNDFKTMHICKTEVLISKHVYISNNFKSLSKIPAHFFLILFTLIEKSTLSVISLFWFTNQKLKTNRYILKNLLIYYVDVIKKQTWLSNRSINYQKL